MSWWRKRRKASADRATWSSIDERNETLAELDSVAADGHLSPEDAVELGRRVAPLFEQEAVKPPLDSSWDERAHQVRTAAAHRAGQYRGKHYTEWLPKLAELRTAGNDDAALVILKGCIAATEREAIVLGWSPAPAYTERAAVIYRRRKDYRSEIKVLKRWLKASPGGRDHHDIAGRLAKAEALLAKSDGRS